AVGDGEHDGERAAARPHPPQARREAGGALRGDRQGHRRGVRQRPPPPAPRIPVGERPRVSGPRAGVGPLRPLTRGRSPNHQPRPADAGPFAKDPMLTGKLVRVRHARNKLVPLYLDPANEGWLALAEQLLFVYRSAPGRTRGEIAEELAPLVGEGPQALLHQGLAKLLEDRCEFEVAADHPPDEIREAAFRAAVRHRSEAARTRTPFDRAAVLADVGGELNLAPEQIEQGLFADLKDEQRVLKFADCTPELLLHRYNVALAQAILLRCTAMEVRIWGE